MRGAHRLHELLGLEEPTEVAELQGGDDDEDARLCNRPPVRKKKVAARATNMPREPMQMYDTHGSICCGDLET